MHIEEMVTIGLMRKIRPSEGNSERELVYTCKGLKEKYVRALMVKSPLREAESSPLEEEWIVEDLSDLESDETLKQWL